LTAGAGRVELVTPQAAAVEFADAAAEPAGRSEYMAALGVRVRSLPEAARHLSPVSGLRIEPHRLIVPAAAAFNTTLVLTE